MKKQSVLILVTSIMAVVAIAVGTFVIVQQQDAVNCTASEAPPVPTYKMTPDPKTGLMPKDTSHMVAPPAGIFPIGVAVGDENFKKFFDSCHTTFTVKQQSVYIARDKYNYILAMYGLNAGYTGGVPLTDDAASSLGLPMDQNTGPTTPPLPLEYLLVPTK